MGMSLAYGKIVSWDGDNIGLKSNIKYQDQTGKEVGINLQGFLKLAKKCKDEKNKEYFRTWIPKIHDGTLSLGVVIIDGLNRLATEHGVDETIKQVIQKTDGVV